MEMKAMIKTNDLHPNPLSPFTTPFSFIRATHIRTQTLPHILYMSSLKS